MEKRALIEIQKELWLHSLKVEPYWGAYPEYVPESDTRVYAYIGHPWWYNGFNYCVTISMSTLHLKRIAIPSRKFPQIKIQPNKTRIQTTVLLRI